MPDVLKTRGRLLSMIAAGAVLASVAGCANAGAGTPHSSATTSPSAVTTSAPTTTATTPTTTTTTATVSGQHPTRHLPITVRSDARMRAAGNAGPSSTAILAASSCAIANGVVTATGTFRGGFAPTVYARYGDVIVLYVFTAPSSDYRDGIQLGELGGAHPAAVAGRGPWKTSVATDAQLGRAQRCVVVAQPTHDFEGAPSAF